MTRCPDGAVLRGTRASATAASSFVSSANYLMTRLQGATGPMGRPSADGRWMQTGVQVEHNEGPIVGSADPGRCKDYWHSKTLQETQLDAMRSKEGKDTLATTNTIFLHEGKDMRQTLLLHRGCSAPPESSTTSRRAAALPGQRRRT